MVSSVHLLEFETLHNYGREKDRIEVPVTLRSGEESVSSNARRYLNNISYANASIPRRTSYGPEGP